jgi:hypothetical protein
MNTARDSVGNWAKTTPPAIANGMVYMTSFPNEESLALGTTEAFTLSSPAPIEKRVIGGEALIAGLCVRQ